MKNLGQRSRDLDIVVKEDLPVIEIGGSSTTNATDIVALGGGSYIWKTGTYIKIGSGNSYSTYKNDSSDDLSFLFQVDSGTQCYFTGSLIFNNATYKASKWSFITTYFAINGVYFSTDVYMRGLINGSTNSNSIYAPTTAGTAGQILQSNGSGAPTWVTGGGGAGVTLRRWS